jgi:glutamine amidotransferase
MCQLFGLTSHEALEVNGLLDEFFSHSEVHAHGWGFASFGAHITHIEKEPTKARESAYLKQILTYPLRATTAFAHIRYATRGAVTEVNCHPFSAPDVTRRRWTLIHNGTISHGDLLEPYRAEQLGETDSERILYCLLDRVNTQTLALGRPLDDRERYGLVRALMKELSPDNSINLMVYDDELLYVYPNERFEEVETACLAAIYRRKTENGYLFSTVPLDDNPWELMRLGEVTVYHKGHLVEQ